MYAVLTSGGKQYRVEPGATLLVERVAGEPGSSVTFDRVLLIADGDDVTVGTPTVSGATITGTILGEELGPKVVIFKFKQKVKYRRRTGHRQHLLRVRIDEISANGKSSRAEQAEERPKQKPRRQAATAKADTKADKAKADTKAGKGKADKATPEKESAEEASVQPDEATDTKPKARRRGGAKAEAAEQSEADEKPKTKRRPRKAADKADKE